MLLLLAILLAFLAQQLVTPYPYDFLGACALLTAHGALLAARGRDTTNRYALSALAALIVLVTVAWKFIPPPLAAGIFIVLACVLFVWQTRNTSATNLAASRTAGVEALADARKSAKASTPRAESQRALHIAIIAVVMLVSAFLCLYDNAHIQPGVHGDEAESGLEARNLNAGRYDALIGVGWYDQPLPSFLAQAVGLKLFGDNVSGLRTTSAVISLLTLPLVYLLTRRMFNARVALIALALMAVAHWFIAYARLGINYNQTLLLELVAVLAFWEGWQTRRWPWFALSGLAVGAGLYLYFASRIVPILLGAFAGYVWFYNISQLPTPKSQTSTLNVQRSTFNVELPISLRHLALWLTIALLVFAPMGLFFLDHAKEFNSRASFVFLFSDTQYNTREEKLKMYTGTTDVPTALMVQVYRYTTVFNLGGDRSGQYGNSLSLLDFYTGVFFVLGLAYALAQWREPRFMLLLLWLALTLFIGGVLTIESPFTPRIIGVMPVPFMLAAVALEQVYFRFQISDCKLRITHPALRITHYASRFALPIVAALLFAAIVYFNYWAYFERYIHTLDGWAQREPATAIAEYAAQLSDDQTMYVVSQPELFVWHGTIRFLAPRLRGYDVTEPELELPIHDPFTQRASFVILPNYLQWLDRLRAVYPHGYLKEFRRPTGEVWYTIYEVNAEEIEAKR